MAVTAPPRRDPGRTRERILRAAQDAFAELGYAHAGIRGISAAAGVDSALVQRYFGSKAGLFEAALIDAIPSFEGFDLAREGFGARVAARYLEASMDLRAQAMIALAAADPKARAISAAVMEEHAIRPLAEWLGPPDARARAIRMTMLSTGFMLYTRHIPLMAAEDAGHGDTTEWLADTLQALIDRT